VDPPQERHLEVIPRLGRAADLVLRASQQIEGPQQILARKTRRQRLQPIALPFGGNLRVGDA
jgi:hypothetical protein